MSNRFNIPSNLVGGIEVVRSQKIRFTHVDKSVRTNIYTYEEQHQERHFEKKTVAFSIEKILFFT